jgi:addiction module HigA family antidote
MIPINYCLEEHFMPKSAKSPADVLKKYMDDYQLNPSKLAVQIKLSQSAIRQISIGKTRISADVALRLAKYFGNKPGEWLDIQNQFDLAKASKDDKTSAALKEIKKAKKPDPAKVAKAAKAAKAAKKGDAKKGRGKVAKAAKAGKARSRKPKAEKPAQETITPEFPSTPDMG